MALLVSTSSSYILMASLRAEPESEFAALKTLSTAQKRFTAVGLALFIASAASSRSSPASSASAIPNAAATPIAGAPRTFMVIIASMTSL